ncbi:OmpA family protein [Treponema sp. OttesenSCG-928-L16]|nr:OmpA family protein [Treponema sp. OttesenSCG-928-L16]
MREIIFKCRILKGLIFLCLPAVSVVYAQDTSGSVLLSREHSSSYTVVERSNWSRYDNGRYTGHVFRELRSSIVPVSPDGGGVSLYRGTCFVLEETLRDMRHSAQAVDMVVPVSFELYRDGTMRLEDDRGFPPLRGFPAYPSTPVRIGSKWTAPGIRAVDPLNEGVPTLIPILAEYQYRGTELYKDIPVYRISAKYASRFQSAGGQSFSRLSGTHDVDILINVSDGLPLLIRDNMDETFTFPDGSTLRFRGFTLTFGEYSLPFDRSVVIAEMENFLSDPSGTELSSSKQPGDGESGDKGFGEEISIGARDDIGISVSSVPEGIRLTMRDIRFEPDSDKILPEEHQRLDMIAHLLHEIPERMFLVEGHTAAVGRPEGELELSIRRAQRMVEELTSRGISTDRFIYKGWGGTRPIGDNNTEPGRRMNRRVEITVLE